MKPGRPFRRTTVQGAGDVFDGGVNGFIGTCTGVSLAAAAAAATAQITDADGTILFDLAAPVNGSHVIPLPVTFAKKLTVAAIAGVGAVLNIYVA